jgi:biotin operon repressor
MEDPIKTAFSRVKNDISNLDNDVVLIKKEISEIKSMLTSLHELLNSKILLNLSKESVGIIPTDTSTNQHSIPTLNNYPTDTPTVPQEVKGLKSPNNEFSSGNEGVPTDRQTDSQTVQQTEKTPFLPYQMQKSIDIVSQSVESNILEASEILGSLDRLKREIRLKFKSLTQQEMLVFSTIYQLEEKDPQNTSYESVASLLHLSESSIRDYTQKLIKKGIPIKKTKVNNRKVLLSISNELKKIATLSTILQLREL